MRKKPKIHIKEENRGKFTEYCKRKGYKKVTQKCIQEGLRSKNLTTRKRAVFAKNTRKWKHK